MNENKGLTVIEQRERGLGVRFERIRRITGYLTGSLMTWGTAKRNEESDRLSHKIETHINMEETA